MTNRLTNEKSPYLLQHADNPVDWYPWGEEAFEKAKEENKPIFLSIGYSTCHWCHVMAHESFEDAEVAKMINDVFVSIKVDREERPDIDKIYMTVCQMMTGQGGWPLTIIMTPDKKPFFAGTYFPKTSQFGRIGITDLINRIKILWNTEKEKILESADQITFTLNNNTNEAPGDLINKKTLRKAYEQLSAQFDKNFGGFGTRPKFPTPHNLIFLLRYWKRTKDHFALKMVEKTLKDMRKGGVYDHLGFGIHRYSTDQKWLVPHFEKMLYDQALVSITYIEAFQATKNEIYANTAREIFSYVLRDMISPEGGFYSAEDADSEGVEGKFYVWSQEEIQKILGKDDAEYIFKLYNTRVEGNFVEEATQNKTGNNILHLQSLEEVNSPRVEKIRRILFNTREKRVHPSKDDKILTDWNGLMIAALAKGGQTLKESKYIDAARKAVDFINSTMKNTKNRLLHRYREGEAEILAYLDDYAFLIWGLIELYETTFDTDYLEEALDLNNELIEHFWDKDIAGFYFYPDDGEQLISRQKEIYDGAIPSGNSVQMLNLLRLSYITGDTELEKKAELISRVFSEKIESTPIAYTQLLVAVDFGVGPSFSLVIAGDTGSDDTNSMLERVKSDYYPNKVLIFRPTESYPPKIDEFSNFIEWFDKEEEKATAYVCINKTCKPPTTDSSKMIEYLDSNW